MPGQVISVKVRFAEIDKHWNYEVSPGLSGQPFVLVDDGQQYGWCDHLCHTSLSLFTNPIANAIKLNKTVFSLLSEARNLCIKKHILIEF